MRKAIITLMLAGILLLLPVSIQAATGYPKVYSDYFPGSTLDSGWTAAISSLDSTSNTSVSSGTLSIANPSAISLYSRRYVLRRPSGGPTSLRNKRVRMKFLMGAPTTQFTSLWLALNTDGTHGYGMRLLSTTATGLLLQRVDNIENATPTVTSTGGGTLTSSLVNGTTYWYECDVTGSGTSTTYITRVYAADGSTLLNSFTSAAQSNANIDQAAYPIAVSTQDAASIYAVEVYDIAAPKITADPANATGAVGSTTTFSITSSVGSQGTGPLTYQWQVSTDAGSTWNNVATGSGGTTTTYTTPTLTLGMDGYKYRPIVTDSGNSKTNTGAAAILSVVALPAPSSIQTNTAGTVVTVTWNGTVTYASPSASHWSLTKGVGNAAVGISSVSHTGNTTTLTLSGTIYSTDTNILLSYSGGTGVIVDGSSNSAPTFSNQTITNNSTASSPAYSIAIPTPYNVVRCRAGLGHIQIPVTVSRTMFTNALSLSLSGLPTGISYTKTDPGTGNLGHLDITASGSAAINTSGITVTVTATDGTTPNTTTFTLYIHSNAVTANAWCAPILGSSTIAFLDSDGGLVNLATVFGGSTNPWTYTSLSAGAGEFGVSGSHPNQWVPEYTGVSNRGYLHEVISWGIQNGARYCLALWPYSNDAGSNTWTQETAWVGPALTYLAANFDAVILFPAYGRWDTTATLTSTVSSVSGNTITLASAPSAGDVGNWLFLSNGTGSDLMARQITGVSGNVVTLANAFTGTVTNGIAANIYASTRYNDMVSYNTGIQQYAQGGSSQIANVFYYDSGVIVPELDYIRSDRIHQSAAFAGIHANLIRDNAIVPFLLRNSTVTVTSASVVTSATVQLARTVSGFSAFGATFWPDNLIATTWSLQSGTGSLTGTGLYTAPSTTGTVVVRATLNNLTPLYGQSTLTRAFPARKTSNQRVGKRNSQ